MIRFMVHRVMDLGKNYVEAYGLSTDAKPTSGLVTGSFFMEVDTGRVFLFDEDNQIWHPMGGAAASPANAENSEEA